MDGERGQGEKKRQRKEDRWVDRDFLGTRDQGKTGEKGNCGAGRDKQRGQGGEVEIKEGSRETKQNVVQVNEQATERQRDGGGETGRESSS